MCSVHELKAILCSYYSNPGEISPSIEITISVVHGFNLVKTRDSFQSSRMTKTQFVLRMHEDNQ